MTVERNDPMKNKLWVLFLCLTLVLTGCAWPGLGDRLSVTPHREEGNRTNPENVSAANYDQLLSAITALVESGAESGLVYVPLYDSSALSQDLIKAIRYVTTMDPIGAYALERIDYELGAGSGQQAVAMELQYLHDRSEIRRIKQCRTMEDARKEIAKALGDCSGSLVVQIGQYEETDFIQEIRDFAEANPSVVMELPEVSVGIYPETGRKRVVELKFSYQTSRDALRSMQSQVRPVFDAAVLYVSGDGEDSEKLSQLYAFLMERFDYQYDSSITPIYSLLRHGVGDSKAFSMVYAAMCRDAGLECLVVPGTRNGEAWYWNMVRIGERYRHVDLLESAVHEGLLTLNDDQMEGYVWDYSAFPACEASEEGVPNLTE